jgi:thiol:disulfide interchange protein
MQNKFVKYLFVGLIFSLLAANVASAQDCLNTDVRWSRIKQYATQNRKIIFLDFYAPWCTPCKKLDKYTYPDESVKEITCHEDVVCLKVNLGDKEGNEMHPDADYLRRKYNVTSFPTMIFLMPDGEELFRTTGFKYPQEFRDWFIDELTNAIKSRQQ